MDDLWASTLLAATTANVAAMAGMWAIGRENLRLRRSLDIVRADLDRVLADRHQLRMDRHNLADRATDTTAKLAGVVRRLWKDRRVRQYNDGAARTEGYLIGIGDAARVMERNADVRLADARSLAMCEELYRG